MKPAHLRGRLRAGSVLAAGTAGSLLLLSAVAPAGAATGPKSGEVAVPQGLSIAGLVGRSVFPKPINGNTKETVSFVLKLRQSATLESDVEASMPHGYLKVGAFASQYGQTKAHLAALQKYLKGYGIKSAAYPDRLDVTATGTARDFNKALSVTQGEYTTKAIPARGNLPARPAVTFHGTTDKPLLPKSLAAFVYSILGLTDYPVASSDAVHTPTREVRSTRKGLQDGNRTPENFAKQYGLDPLYAKGARGRGQTIGIITYASLRASDPSYFWSQILHIKTKADRIKLDDIDGGSGKVSLAAGSDETTLDVEQSGAVAPYANIVVYQAPNTDFGSADAWFAAASQNVAATISTSWGESEIMNEAMAANKTGSATYNGIFDEAALEMAAQGQSAFDAAGDSGAYDDTEDFPTAYTELSVDNPADSSWITSAGGTTEAGTIQLYDSYGDPASPPVTIAAQRTWGWDYLFPYYYLFPDSNDAFFTTEPPFVADPAYATGGGGGYSVVEKQPAYQSKIKGIDDYSYVGYDSPTQCPSVPVTPMPTGCAAYPGTNIVLPTAWTAWPGASSAPATPPAVQTATYSGPGGRAVPDIAADADPYTGYELYMSQLGGLAIGWGGTSFVAPQLNGSAAVIDSFLHHRTGFWNPEIYSFAEHPSYTPFTPLDSSSASNDNLYYTGTAKAVYNPGSGLGVPNLDKLALDFRRHPL